MNTCHDQSIVSFELGCESSDNICWPDTPVSPEYDSLSVCSDDYAYCRGNYEDIDDDCVSVSSCPSYLPTSATRLQPKPSRITSIAKQKTQLTDEQLAANDRILTSSREGYCVSLFEPGVHVLNNKKWHIPIQKRTFLCLEVTNHPDQDIKTLSFHAQCFLIDKKYNSSFRFAAYRDMRCSLQEYVFCIRTRLLDLHNYSVLQTCESPKNKVCLNPLHLIPVCKHRTYMRSIRVKFNRSSYPVPKSAYVPSDSADHFCPQHIQGGT